MKTSKRILSVTINRMVDVDPDTSYYGEYSDTATSRFSIDRATDDFVTKDGLEWLERIEAHLSWEYDELNDSLPAEEQPTTHWLFQLDAAIATVNDLRAELDEDNNYWNNREYRYFNPSDNYVDAQGEASDGNTPEDVRKYVRQDFERMEDYNKGFWGYIGIRAEAKVSLTGDIVQDITSGGLWGIESDFSDSDFEEVKQEELGQLRDQLKTLGFSSRAISTAFKNVQEKES